MPRASSESPFHKEILLEQLPCSDRLR